MAVFHKFHAVATERDGIKFPSKKEARRYDDLVLLQEQERVVMFLRHPSFDLGGGTRYSADFLVFWADGTVSIEDTKGMKTTSFIKARKQVETRYPVEIRVL